MYIERKKYNLRSAKTDTIQIPLQLHLSDNNDFLTNLLGTENAAMSHQALDSSLSGSELECKAVIQ